MNLRMMEKFKLLKKKKLGAEIAHSSRKLIKFRKIKKNCMMIFKERQVRKVTVKLKI